MALHRAGRLAEAAAGYRAILSAAPEQTEALHLLGVVHLQLGQYAQGQVLIERAIAFDPATPRYYESMGEGLAAQGQHARALAYFENAQARGANSPTFLFNLGLTALKADAPAKAEPALRALLAAQPDHVDALVDLAAALKKLERANEGEPFLRRALEKSPDNAAALNNLAMLLRDRDDFDEAERLVTRALAVQPDFVDAIATFASILAARLQLPEAVAAYERAITLEPNRAKAHSALATVLHEQRKFSAALEANARAIALDPNSGENHFNRALFLFANGRMAEGWQEYEWRWRNPSVPARWRPFPQPRWNGAPLSAGQKLLVWAEQGVGDEVLYASFLPDLIARGIDLIFECDERLVPLIARSFPTVTVVPRRDQPDPATADARIAAQISGAGLGAILRPDMASFPKRDSFLVAVESVANDFRKRVLGRSKDKLIGISWLSQNRAHATQKSAPLRQWEPILRQTGMRFVDLQYGETSDERAGRDIIHLDALDQRVELDRLAALVSACDLVITVCNTTAHLAGALGKPVWILVPHERGRLWWTFLGRSDSPWYASARFFRQTNEGDWSAPIAEIATALAGEPLDQAKAVPATKSRRKAKPLTRKKN